MMFFLSILAGLTIGGAISAIVLVIIKSGPKTYIINMRSIILETGFIGRAESRLNKEFEHLKRVSDQFNRVCFIHIDHLGHLKGYHITDEGAQQRMLKMILDWRLQNESKFNKIEMKSRGIKSDTVVIKRTPKDT